MIAIEITPHLITEMLTTGNEVHGKVLDGLPDGSKLISIDWASRDGNVLLMFSCPGHDNVTKGITVRDLRGTCKEHT